MKKKYKKEKYFRWFAVSTCPPGQVLAGPDMSKVRFFFNFARFGSKTEFLTKFLDDSAWFCLEKLNNMFFSIKFYGFWLKKHVSELLQAKPCRII